ncbi:Hsp20/alpha crystallin family protein [Lacinutrix salivirga]
MSNLINVPKNGSLTNTNSTVNFPRFNWLDEVLNSNLPSMFSSNFTTELSLPKVNIKENAEAFLVELAAPGLKKNDFNLDLDNQVLSISTEVKKEDEHQEEGYTRKEFEFSSFKRTFTLPESVDEDKIEAKYKDGILNILLPKREEAKKKPARTIKIS